MLITPEFVFINNPRTGTTYSRQAIRAAYPPKAGEEVVQELILPKKRGWKSTSSDHHGTYEQIPLAFSHLPVASAVRNPFTLAVSSYELGIWRSRAPTENSVLRRFKHYPHLSLLEYLQLQDSAMPQRWGVSYEEHGMGAMSAHFIQMFAVSSDAAFERVRLGRSFEEIFALIARVHFLRQEALSVELSDFLGRFAGADLVREAVLSRPRHVTNRKQAWCVAALGGSVITHLTSREAFLFEYLRTIGIHYTAESADFSQPA